MDQLTKQRDKEYLSNYSNRFKNYSDEISTENTEVSQLPRCNPDFSMEDVVIKYKKDLDQVRSCGNWCLVIEDLMPRTSGKVIPMKKKFFQIKGMVYSVGEKVRHISKGNYVVFGLYNSLKINFIDHAGDDIRTYFVLENKILTTVNKDARLTE